MTQERNQPAKSRVHTSLGLSLARVLALVVVICLTNTFCMSRAEESAPVARVNQAKSDTIPVKRPVTVPDFIQMTRLGDTRYSDGFPSKGLVAKFSPDGKRFVVVLRRGNLRKNTNDYSLILFNTDEVFLSPNPRALLSMSSSSNRPAIQNVVWMDDSDTILFLGERPGETPQLNPLKAASKELKNPPNPAPGQVPSPPLQMVVKSSFRLKA